MSYNYKTNKTFCKVIQVGKYQVLALRTGKLRMSLSTSISKGDIIDSSVSFKTKLIRDQAFKSYGEKNAQGFVDFVIEELKKDKQKANDISSKSEERADEDVKGDS